MRLSILSILSTVLVGLVCATTGFAGGVPATKASASVANNIKLAGCIESVNHGGCLNNFGDWKPLIDTYIKPPGGKDLLITVSMQSGLFNGALSAPALILQTSGLRVEVVDTVNGATKSEDVEPGKVTWDRTLNFLIDFIPKIDLNLESGVRSFTFVERNAPVGIHHIVVNGRFEIIAGESNAGVLGSFAFVSHRTLTVEQVSLPPATN